MDDFEFTPETALSLSLSGSCGSFKVGKNNESIEVKYLLTHVSLDHDSSNDKALLKELAPFREIFKFKDLHFDEIMQRDIDDARVSHKLIPYILDKTNQVSVKFFPPIVVLLLPTIGEQVMPAEYYDDVTYGCKPLKEVKGVKSWHVTTSGEPGSEVFQFEQPILYGDSPDNHNFVKLRINPNKSKLVIVDGQHRAMALLALYRNTQNGWDGADKEAFMQYYEEWTPEIINSYDLSEIKLPMIICTLPDLDKKYEGDFNLKKAARSIFLTLNQNAMPVSNTRNLLLNDNDIISSFLRGILSKIKDKDINSEDSFRIFNVELDQVDNKIKLQSTTAITGVQHLYYIIEHLLLNTDDVNGVTPRSGRFKTRKSEGYINGLKKRLNTANVLGTALDATITRSSFSLEVEDILNKQFLNTYGNSICQMMERFFPYVAHCDSVISLKSLIDEKSDRTIKSVFFDGQGVARVFQKHRESLNEKFAQNSSPELKELLQRINSKAKAIDDLDIEFKHKRFVSFVSNLSDRSKISCKDGDLSDKLQEIIHSIYDNTLSTIAFQSALVCGFFHIIEQISNTFDGETDIDNNKELENYLENLNDFFMPKSFSQLKRFICIFAGQITGENADAIQFIERSSDSFRGVVCRSEMQPDLWTKYRYIFLELWRPLNSELMGHLQQELTLCREQVFTELYDDGIKKLCKARLIHESDLTDTLRNEVFEECFSSFKSFIKNLTGTTQSLQPADFKRLI